MTPPMLTTNDHARQSVANVVGVALPPAEEITTIRWRATDGAVLLECSSSSREPYYLPEKFYTSERLRELHAAIGAALEREAGK